MAHASGGCHLRFDCALRNALQPAFELCPRSDQNTEIGVVPIVSNAASSKN
jgi:hypothetical protein